MKKFVFLIIISLASLLARSQVPNVSEFISWNKLSLQSIQTQLKKDGFKYWQQEKYSKFKEKDVNFQLWRHFDKDSIEIVFGFFLLESKPIILTYMSNNISFFESRKAAISKYGLKEYIKIDNKDKLQENYKNELYALMILGSIIENRKNVIYYTTHSEDGLMILQTYLNRKQN